MEKVYIAAPLFTPQERALNIHLAEMLEKSVKTFLPQRDGILIPGQKLNSEDFARLSADVFANDIAAIQNCDYLLAILDGRSVDEGVAFELGYAYAIGRVCIGFRTDARSLLPYGNNPMIERCLKFQFRSEEELLLWVSEQFSQKSKINTNL